MNSLYKIIDSNGKEYGPMDEEAIQRWYVQKRITKDTLIFVSFRNQWARLGDVFDVSKWESVQDFSSAKQLLSLSTPQSSLSAQFPPVQLPQENSVNADAKSAENQIPSYACKNCGGFINSTMKYCPFCSSKNEAPTEAATINEKEIVKIVKDEVQISEKYKGVGGWLLLFCIGLIVFGPLLFCSSIANLTPSTIPINSLRALVRIDLFCSALLMLLGMAVGIGLIKNKTSEAVKFAKAYLIIRLAYALGSIPLPYLLDLPSDIAARFVASLIGNAIAIIIYFAIWYLYLSKSKRVKATYYSNSDNGDGGEMVKLNLNG